MCGIGGFVGEGDAHTLERMCTTLTRRGPDDHGVAAHGVVGLANTRLAVIDLSPAGHQPMTSASGKSVIAYNGEIYNFKKLRDEVKRTHAYEFKSETDTEVILALYETYGEQSFTKLEGMFAFALHDRATDSVYLVRDRMGKKPLYWTVVDHTLIFGSELKTLMAHPLFKKELNHDALAHYLVYEHVPTPLSILKGVRKLQPASYLKYREEKEPQEIRYWEPSHEITNIALSDAEHTLDTLIKDAVAKRLVSDVPLGIFLSGGIDSSTVAYYAREASGERVKTFSIGFTEQDHDESDYAAAVARHLGVEHAVEHFSARKCIELIPDIFSYVDEPLADYSLLPTYLLSAFTRKHVTVALGGDGADELFAGYPTFQAERLVGLYRSLPRALRESLIEPAVRALPVQHAYMSLDFKLKKFIEGADEDLRYRHQHWLGAFAPEELSGILRPEFRYTNAPYAMLDQYFSHTSDRSRYLNELLWSYARTYLMDQVLVKVDRASMANSLEVRAPFLDTALVEFVTGLPYDYKFRRGSGKYLLKRLMRGKLPRAVVHRRKKGFSIPMAAWLRGDLLPLARDLLSEQALRESGVFEPVAAKRLLEGHVSGVQDNRKKLWTLMAFQLWYRNWYA